MRSIDKSLNLNMTRRSNSFSLVVPVLKPASYDARASDDESDCYDDGNYKVDDDYDGVHDNVYDDVQDDVDDADE